MRLLHLIFWDICFQIKYGIYMIYAILTVLYLVLLGALPPAWRTGTAVILIFSDPAAMGLFFMGAVILLEKSQRVVNALAVSPVTVREYIISKTISLGVLSVIVALILALSMGMEHIPLIAAGTGLLSAVFTLLGIIAAAHISSLNQFLLYTVPIEIVCFVPALLYFFGIGPDVLRYYPVSVGIQLLMGNTSAAIPGILLLLLIIILLFWVGMKSTLKMFQTLGGVKL